jgi:hypothetical protein
MFNSYLSDLHVPVRRLQRNPVSGALVEVPKTALFLRGPVPLVWLGQAAALPGKTLHVAIALWWRHGMAKGQPFKLTQKALEIFDVERDAASRGLARLEHAGLIQVERRPGQRPTIAIVIVAAPVTT